MGAKYQQILLIDDDADDREIFLAAIENISAPVQCTVLPDARAALQQLNTGTIAPDLIFLDLNMPVMNGPEFLELIKQTAGLKHIPVIILSTSSQPATIEHTKNLGAEDFITKPSKFSELVSRLQSILN